MQRCRCPAYSLSVMRPCALSAASTAAGRAAVAAASTAAAGAGGSRPSRAFAVTASTSAKPGMRWSFSECGKSRSSLTEASTEFEHKFDNAVTRHLPRPGPGGFTRGSFIGYRRRERMGDVPAALEQIYELGEKLGEGAFGVVHAAHHRRTGESVAIKAIHKDKVKEPEELVREVEFLKGVDHPNVIRYYETLQDEEYHYLVMERCTGGALSDHIKLRHDNDGPGIPEADVARVAQQMLRGIAYCHSHSIVHRDVKPSNFLFGCGSPRGGSTIPISCSGENDAPLKLVDFGISGVVRGDRPGKRFLTRRAGTDGYMAPEVNLGQPYGRSADLFSLGAVMHKMITGLAPQWVAEQKAYKFPGKVRWGLLSPAGRDLLKAFLNVDAEARPTACKAIKDPWFREMGVEAPEAIAEVFRKCTDRMHSFAGRSKLQRSIMYSTVAFAALHSDEMEKLRMAFLAADASLTGGLSQQEFAEVVRKHGKPGLDPSTLFAAVNVSRTGQISYSEWLAATAPREWFCDARHAERSFVTMDINGHGWLDASDLCHLLPDVFDRRQIEDEIRRLFPSDGGRITFEDFCAVSCQGASAA